jgi:hypothetical protein
MAASGSARRIKAFPSGFGLWRLEVRSKKKTAPKKSPWPLCQDGFISNRTEGRAEYGSTRDGKNGFRKELRQIILNRFNFT